MGTEDGSDCETEDQSEEPPTRSNWLKREREKGILKKLVQPTQVRWCFVLLTQEYSTPELNFDDFDELEGQSSNSAVRANT